MPLPVLDDGQLGWRFGGTKGLQLLQEDAGWRGPVHPHLPLNARTSGQTSLPSRDLLLLFLTEQGIDVSVGIGLRLGANNLDIDAKC